MKKLLINPKILFLLLWAALVSVGAGAQETDFAGRLPGKWSGKLAISDNQLTLVFHFSKRADGLTGSLDSPDQGAVGIPISAIRLTDDSLILEVSSLMAGFRGVLAKDGRIIQGTWEQSGLSLPLELAYTEIAPVPLRPQEPVPPFPYREEEITFKNQFGGIVLGGTLSIPEGEGPFPAVVLISGSGQQNRDQEIMGHKPFRVISDFLARRNIAVLRYDDRGTSASGGNFSTATTLDFANDAKAAFDFLRADPRIVTNKIGLIGHSEGGLIAPIVASQNLAVAFIIMLAGPAVPGEILLPVQSELISRAMGEEDKSIKESNRLARELYQVLKRTPDTAEAAVRLTALLMQKSKDIHALNKLAPETLQRVIASQVSLMNGPWFRTFLTLDPASYLEQTRCPLLALYGEKDLQVPPSLNVKPLKKALGKAGNPDYEVLEIAGANHLFQPARTGSPDEYGTITTTLSPKVLDIMAAWLALKIK